MPIREYICLRCEHEFEILEGMDERTGKCEECGGKVESQIGVPMIIFKGTGFYSTEYGKSPHRLEPKDQARRAARECRKAELKVAKPMY